MKWPAWVPARPTGSVVALRCDPSTPRRISMSDDAPEQFRLVGVEIRSIDSVAGPVLRRRLMYLPRPDAPRTEAVLDRPYVLTLKEAEELRDRLDQVTRTLRATTAT